MGLKINKKSIKKKIAKSLKGMKVDLATEIRAEAQRLEIRDRGLLQKSIKPSDKGVIVDVPYATFVEYGRRRGAKMPPDKPIREWVIRKGIPERLTWVIRKAIADNGIKPKPFVANGLQNFLDKRKQKFNL